MMGEIPINLGSVITEEPLIELISIDEKKSKTEIKDGKLIMTIFAELRYEYEIKFNQGESHD